MLSNDLNAIMIHLIAFVFFRLICYDVVGCVGLCIYMEVYMKSNESVENYLETILILSKQLPVVRSVDIANELGFKKSSISIAMKNLREKEYITVTDAGFIYLTASGKELAESIYERHEVLSNWFIKLGVPEAIALEDACKIEHFLSKESFEAIKKHINEQ